MSLVIMMMFISLGLAVVAMRTAIYNELESGCFNENSRIQDMDNMYTSGSSIICSQ